MKKNVMKNDANDSKILIDLFDVSDMSNKISESNL